MYNYNHELHVDDVESCLSRPVSSAFPMPTYVIEAAKKAGKVYNQLTGHFEDIKTKKDNGDTLLHS